MKPFAFSQLLASVRQMVEVFLQGENPFTPVLLFSVRCLLENINVFREQLQVDHLFSPSRRTIIQMS